jgi:hypothetical protein
MNVEKGWSVFPLSKRRGARGEAKRCKAIRFLIFQHYN